MPFVSIIIPCYNHANWLPVAIKSVLEQSFKEWELIIVNDGSTDESLEIGELFCKMDSRICMINQANAGLSAARNAGMKVAKGEWLNFLDADDYYYPDCLESVASIALRYPNYELIQTEYNLIDQDGLHLLNKTTVEEDGYFLTELEQGNPGPPLSMFIKKQLTNDVGVFDITLKSAEDWDFWLRAAKIGAKRFIIHQPLVAYRYSSNSMSRNAFQMYQNINLVIERTGVKDLRLPENCLFNETRNLNTKLLLKTNLIQCASMLVIKGDLYAADTFFREEAKKYQLTFSPQDFSKCCSYLTFRDFVLKKDLDKILSVYPGLFNKWLKQLGCSVIYRQYVSFYIFRKHKKIYWINRFGTFYGKFRYRLYQLPYLIRINQKIIF